LAIEKYLLVKRGLFSSDRRRGPYGWTLDAETAREFDRLFARLGAAMPRGLTGMTGSTS
jgi:4-hydroxy-tetrahydrodipicolinate synthase